jgi:signal transduction histidine kinase
VKLGLRRRIVLVAVGSFGIGLALLLTAFNVMLARHLSSEAQSVLDSRVAAQRANLHVVDGHVRVREGPGDAALDGASWVFQGRRRLERANLPPTLRPLTRRLVAQGRPVEADAGDTRVLAEPRPVGHGTSATVVAAISLAPYEDTRELAFVGSLVVGAALLGLVAVITSRSVAGALRPVRRMTEQAATWSQRDLHRRFDLGEPHDELTTLAARLDDLLGRIDTSFQHEQRFSAEVAHELRTPLARQRAEIELALRDGSNDWARAAFPLLLREVDRMTVIIDTLVAAARAELIPERGVAASTEVIARTLDAVRGANGESGVSLEPPNARRAVAIAVETNYAVQTLLPVVLLPVVDNALRHADSRVAIGCAKRAGDAVFAVTDDGPGVDESEREAVFEPGVRGNSKPTSVGAGLGLALARRLARAVGGDVVALASPRGGHFEVVLPAVQGSLVGGE